MTTLTTTPSSLALPQSTEKTINPTEVNLLTLSKRTQHNRFHPVSTRVLMAVP